MSERRLDTRSRLEQVRIYLITDALPRVQPMQAFLRAAIAGGVGMVQLRERAMTDRALLELARECKAVCAQAGVPFIVNDRLDIALSCGADGVHLGQDDLPPGTARRLVGERFIIGLSTHSQAQIDDAASAGADYIGVGPVYETPTKQGRPAVGTELVRYAAQHAQQPFFPIGGIDADNLASVIAAGARSVSVLRWIAQAPDPTSAARELDGQLQTARRLSGVAGSART